MKSALSAALMLVVAATACAQRSGPGTGSIGRPGGGFSASRGFSSAGTPRGGGTLSSRGNYASQSQSYHYSSAIGSAPFGGAYPGGAPPAGGYPQSGGYGPHHRGYSGPGGRPYPYGSGIYVLPGWIGSSYYGYGYNYGYPSADQAYTGDYSAPVQEQPSMPQEMTGNAAYEQQQESVASTPRQEYQTDSAPSPASPAGAAAGLHEQPGVTLLFKDGRPSQQVQNYALTRTTLYVFDGVKRREIPLDELDLPRTERANREAGIDFDVPRAY